MSLRLITEAELAEQIGISPDAIVKLRWKHKWPHVGIGKHIRYTDAQVEAIIAMHTVTPDRQTTPKVTGQTQRSASARRAS